MALICWLFFPFLLKKNYVLKSQFPPQGLKSPNGNQPGGTSAPSETPDDAAGLGGCGWGGCAWGCAHEGVCVWMHCRYACTPPLASQGRLQGCTHALAANRRILVFFPIPSFLTHFHVRQMTPSAQTDSKMRLTQEPESCQCTSRGASAAPSSPLIKSTPRFLLPLAT